MFLIALKYMLGDIQKGRPADPVGGGSSESGRSIVIRL